jgi:hypothetical protein
MDMNRFLTILALVAVAFVAGCKDLGTAPQSDPVTTPPPSGVVSFSGNVLPILTNAGCTGCHGGSGGLFVGTVAQLLTGGNHGPAIVAGNAESSNLVKKLLSPPPFGSRMPFGGTPLPDSSITVIRNWINQGAANN